MKLLLRYLKDQMPLITVGILCNIIIISVLLLFEIPLDIILYPLAICDVLVISYGLIRFFQMKTRFTSLTAITHPEVTDISRYPAMITCMEQEEFRIIASLTDQIRTLQDSNEKAVRDMIDYYTVWVHQIKTPIAAMKLHLQNEDTRFSRSLQTDLFHIEQYVEMVLAYLRLSSSQTDYRFAQYDIDEILRKVIRKSADEFIERKLTLHYDPVGIKAITDAKWLGFVFEQVLSNALKYTPSGSISIYASDADTICIKDTGIGILEEDLPRIFENGFTGYNGRLSPQASGLGLSLCQKICHNLNHEIHASSTVGEGTIISISLRQHDNLTTL